MQRNIEIGGPYPGVLGEVVGWHGRYYAEHWGHDQSFETEVCKEFGEFMEAYDPARDAFLVARQGGRYCGSVVLDASTAPARLRWFFVPPALCGQGVGGALMERFMGLVAERGISGVYLWTYQGLDAARALYLRAGFTVREERRMARWGVEPLMRRYQWDAPG